MDGICKYERRTSEYINKLQSSNQASITQTNKQTNKQTRTNGSDYKSDQQTKTIQWVLSTEDDKGMLNAMGSELQQTNEEDTHEQTRKS